jgi:hypothetical protein
MRVAVLATIVACVATTTVAQEDAFLKGDALQAVIAKDCAEGCITFNREEAEQFEAAMQALVMKAQRAAFEAGVRHQQQACASLI